MRGVSVRDSAGFFSAVVFLSFALLASGCSKNYFAARYYLYRAGQKFYETDNKLRRIKKIPFEERKRFYAVACDFYLKAYRADRGVFSLDEIEHAMQSCESGEDSTASDIFQKFQQDYERKHPVESDYGMIAVPSGDG